jgi:hydroxymethylbilane synthase
MYVNKLRIATRISPLAQWQACHVKDQLCQIHSDLEVELVNIKTEGDKILDTTLSNVGGKGLFIKELEEALLSNSADIAVHSMKDVTIDIPSGLTLSTMMKREDPRDVFISNEYKSLVDLPPGARVGTSSLRRQCQIKAKRPDLEIQDLRGNIGTRLRKLDDGIYDAIILAAAGVKRLGVKHVVKEYLDIKTLLPAIGQGVIGIEVRKNDHDVHDLVKPLNDSLTQQGVEAERAFSRRLFGGCQLPIAAYAIIENNNLQLEGMVGRVNGEEIISGSIEGPLKEREELGCKLAEQLLSQGADIVLQEILNA